jgi:putative membrane protein
MNRLLKTLLALLFTSALTLFAAAQEGRTANTPMSNAMSKNSAADSDATFMKKAAQANMGEVELGKLAVEKASSENVKKFGQRMIDDHTKAFDQLSQVASTEHVNLPDGLSMEDKVTEARLKKLNGQEFDRAYMKDMVKDHKTDVAEFEHASESLQDPAAKNFAQQTLPTLQDHLKEAEQIAPTQQHAKGE